MPTDPMPDPQPNPQPDRRDTVIRRRPQIAADTEAMAADVEDEEADPVIDTGPGIADGPNTRPLPGPRP